MRQTLNVVFEGADEALGGNEAREGLGVLVALTKGLSALRVETEVAA